MLAMTKAGGTPALHLNVPRASRPPEPKIAKAIAALLSFPPAKPVVAGGTPALQARLFLIKQNDPGINQNQKIAAFPLFAIGRKQASDNRKV